MKIIDFKIKADCRVVVPGSKSYTHRYLIGAALSDGQCLIRRPLFSEDTLYTAAALQQMGARIVQRPDAFEVTGCAGRFQPVTQSIDVGNSGTSMRLLIPLGALGQGNYTFTGTTRMQQRPVQDLLDALRQAGVTVAADNNNGCPPVTIAGGSFEGGVIELDCRVSSQYLSALLLAGVHARCGVDIRISRGLVSRPYIDITVDVLTRMGIEVQRDGYDRFRIEPGQSFQPGAYTVEPDLSQASYFWAAAAISGARVTVADVCAQSCQGDAGFPALLEKMGCCVDYGADQISVTGGRLSGIEADMSTMPDLVPSLAVVAAYARGVTTITNIEHLKVKESDRIAVVISELAKMGIEACYENKRLTVQGGCPQPALIDPHDDHRMAMAFAVAGLMAPGTRIDNEACVAKSFPGFWDVFEQMRVDV